MPDIALVNPAITSAPKDYKIPGSSELLLKAVTANVDGTSAGGTFLPALQLLDPAGNVMWTAVARSLPVAAGGTANVSWFPGGGVDEAGPSSSTATGTISELSSPLGTISVTNPIGPSTLIDLPASGVVAGTYGDATHTAQVTIDAEGVVTNASQVGISGLAGSGMVLLFDQTLGSNQLTIDTGANAIPTGHGVLFIFVYARSNRAANALDNLGVLFNNDSGANYDQQRASAAGTTFSALGSTGSASVLSGADIPGATAPANSFGMVELRIPSYDSTAGFKTVAAGAYNPQNSTTVSQWQQWAAEWRSTSAINQVTINSATGSNLITGSRMQIYGAQ